MTFATHSPPWASLARSGCLSSANSSVMPRPKHTSRYAHLDTDPLRRASNTIGAEIAAAMGDVIRAADVLPLKGAPR